MCQAPHVRTTFGSWDVEKVRAVVARSTFRSQKCKKLMGSEHFWTFRCRFAWQAQGILWTVRRTWKFSSSFNSVGRRGTFWRGSTKMHFAWQAQYKRHVHQRLGGQGADFLRGVAFWSIRSSGLLRWFCVTGAAFRMTWHHFLRQAQHFRQMEWKNCKTQWYEAVSSLHPMVYFWRKSRRIASFLLSTSKIDEVSQNCFVLTLSSSKIEEVSQNGFVFKLADSRYLGR